MTDQPDKLPEPTFWESAGDWTDDKHTADGWRLEQEAGVRSPITPLYSADQLRAAILAAKMEERALWQQDAERYRWLRDDSDAAPDNTPTVYSHRVVKHGRLLRGEDMDAAIDAAKAKPLP